MIGTLTLSVLTPVPSHPVLFCRRWNAEQDITPSTSETKKHIPSGDAADIEHNRLGGVENTKQCEDTTNADQSMEKAQIPLDKSNEIDAA